MDGRATPTIETSRPSKASTMLTTSSRIHRRRVQVVESAACGAAAVLSEVT